MVQFFLTCNLQLRCCILKILRKQYGIDNMLRILLSFILCFAFSSSLYADNPTPEQVFEFQTTFNSQNQLSLEWHIAKGYHLYRDHLHITTSPESQVKLSKILLPPGKKVTDEVLGTYQIYAGEVKIPLPLQGNHGGLLNMTVEYQGCSDKGFCFPPVKKALRIKVPETKAGEGAVSLAVTTPNVVVTSEMQKLSDQNYAQTLFQGHSFFVIILSFLGLGLLLAFTPCVLPMIPILSGIIVGQGKQLNTAKSFMLSFVYVFGMAITYAIAGIIVALVGSRIQTLFQTTWAIIAVSGLFVLLSLSLFGFYELDQPKKLKNLFTRWSNQQKGGTYIGVFLMGVLSSLIISPCVSAPLVGVLAYIAQTGNTVLGGTALLALGFGMGIPLLLVGISAGKILPKAGAWMETVKKLFGIMMLGVAIWILSRIIPGQVSLVLWATLLIGSAFYFSPFSKTRPTLGRITSAALLVYGGVLVVGAALGNVDPLHPLRMMQKTPSFIIVKNMSELDKVLADSKRRSKPVLLDFYADWCVSCVKLDRSVFVLPKVKKELQDFVLLRADVTNNNEFDKALLKRFNVVAPPTILFFTGGNEVTKERIVGEVDALEFLQHKEQLGLKKG